MYRILVVSKDQLFYSAVKALTKTSVVYEVTDYASSVKEAVLKSKTEAFDIALLDCQGGVPKDCQLLSGMMLYMVVTCISDELLAVKKKYNVNGFIEKPLTIARLDKIFGKYHHNYENEYHRWTNQLISMLKEKDYGKIYYGIDDLSDTLYRISGADTALLQKLLTRIVDGLQEVMAFTGDGVTLEELDNNFHLNTACLHDRMALKYWLFRLMNFCLRKSCIECYPIMKGVFSYVDAHIHEDISLNTIVHECAISQVYLSRIFQKQYHISVMNYIHMQKISLAGEYLYFTEYSIADISFKLGYNESSYFSKIFKKYEHLTCTEFRNRTKGMEKAL